MTLCAPKGRSDRSPETRLANRRVFEPMVEDECPNDTLAPVKPVIDRFSPLPVHLSPVPLTINSVSPLVKGIADSVDEDDHYFKLRPPSPEEGDKTPVEYPAPLIATPASKPMVIGAAIARFYDMAASETSTSLPHPTPSTYYNRRYEKEKEKEKLRELSRNNSSGSTGRVPLSRIRALQEKLVPESGDEAERARSSRRQLLNAILADAPTPQSTPAPIITAPPPPTPPPPPPPPPRRPTGISRASTAAEVIERERERRRRQSSENRGPETPIASVPAPPPPPPPQPQSHALRLAQPRPSMLSLKDVSNPHGAEEGMQRRYTERRSATSERRPSIGKPQSQWHRASPEA
ncbi:hypothetical protein BC827DRAFT_846215 [Russula dissimulans]|nr:hypothetical protein BC827DRAFT_846215 [Russula dissimulans]